MIKLAIFSVLTLLIVSVVATGVFAIGFAPRGESEERPNFEEMNDQEVLEWRDGLLQRHADAEEHRALVESAIEEGDYDAWVLAMEDRNNPRTQELLEVITEYNFNTFVLMHNARNSGDQNLAEEYAEELGLERFKMIPREGMGSGNGQGRGHFGGQGMRGSGNCLLVEE